jgi:hypothetical protein
MIKLIIAYAIVSIALVATGIFSVIIYNDTISIVSSNCE